MGNGHFADEGVLGGLGEAERYLESLPCRFVSFLFLVK